MATRMVKFEFSATVAYMMEFGNEYISFFFDGALLDGDGAPVVSPYLEADLPQLQFEQVGDVIWITHEDYPQYKLSRTSVITFSLDVVVYEKGPFLLRNDVLNDDDVTLSYTIVTGDLTAGGTGTLAASADTFEAGHVGALFELTYPREVADGTVSTTAAAASDLLDVKGSWGFNTHGTWTGTVSIERTQGDNDPEIFRTFIGKGDRNIQLSATENEYNVQYRILPVAGMSADFSGDLTANSSTIQGIVRITAVANATTATATILSLLGGTSGDDILRWSEGSWSDVQGYPKSTTFFGDRCVFGAGRTGWQSRTSDYENFDTGINDDNAFTVKLTTGNEIMWVNTVDETIVFGTTGAPWTLKSNKVGTVLTPTNFNLDEQSGLGSADIGGIKINNVIIHVDFMGKKIMEYAFNAQIQKYVSNEITILAEDFTDTSTITWLAYQRRPESIIWFGMADGTLHSFSYQRDQNVLAYAPHPTTGTVNSGAVIPGDTEDEIWLSVERALDAGTITAIERMTPRRVNDIDDEHFVDCAVVYDSTPATNITGLDHLDGETVAILADGLVVAPQVVAAGAITLATAASVVHVGLPYAPWLKPMRLDTDDAGGSSHGSIKRIPELVLSLLETKNASYGLDETNRFDVPWDVPSVENLTKIAGLFAGDVPVVHNSGFSVTDPILISSSTTDDVVDPTPLTVRAIVARVNKTGR